MYICFFYMYIYYVCTYLYNIYMYCLRIHSQIIIGTHGAPEGPRGSAAVFQDGHWNFQETSQVQMATEGTEMTALSSTEVMDRSCIPSESCGLLIQEASSKQDAELHHVSMKDMWSHHCIQILLILITWIFLFRE